MRTAGVDLAAEPVRTALAWVEWSADGARVGGVETGAGDDAIIDAVGKADKAGIDCPFGWPDAFVDFVVEHRNGNVEVPEGRTAREWRRGLALRITDQVVYEKTGLTPLSVSADRIGHTAMRCAAILSGLARRGEPVDRSGTGVVVEVYPAASLKGWGLPYRNYKRAANLDGLGKVVDELKAAAPWLDFGEHEELCRLSDDALDAVVAALTARAAALHMTDAPPPEHIEAARNEGWMALPSAPLSKLL